MVKRQAIVTWILLLILLFEFKIGAAQENAMQLIPQKYFLTNIRVKNAVGKQSSHLLLFSHFKQSLNKEYLFLILRKLNFQKTRLSKRKNLLEICSYNSYLNRYQIGYQENGSEIKWIQIFKNSMTPFLLVERVRRDNQIRWEIIEDIHDKFSRILKTPWGIKDATILYTYKNPKISFIINNTHHTYQWNPKYMEFKALWKVKRLVWRTPVPVKKSTHSNIRVVSKPLNKSERTKMKMSDWGLIPLISPSLKQAFIQLLKQIPKTVRSHQTILLGKDANHFFYLAQKKQLSTLEFIRLREIYLTNVAQAFWETGDRNNAEFYLNLVLKAHPNFQPALQLRSKLK
jgi:hypothetical protein